MPTDHTRDLGAGGPVLGHQPLGGPQHPGVVRPGQAPVTHDGQDPTCRGDSGVPRASSPPSGRPPPSAATRAPCPRGKGRLAAIRFWARTIRDAAMSSIALVIFLVDCTLRIRRRSMRSWPPAMRQSTFPVSNPSRNVVRPLSSSSPPGSAPVVRIDSSTAGVVALEVLDQFGLEAAYFADRHGVGPALGPGVNDQHLLLDRHRLRSGAA